ncbi:MAG: Stk1 family PASTA domain-containing Ser/Thr kinase [Oscillospiraceae bacterium]|nr:Stk1 family PASTA domain-containing Ser/Thr kinase [Oscillospiraceae bacterium]
MDNNSMERYLGQMLDGRYSILETIGRGGMAWVFKAHDHLLNRNVAIKILRDDMAADSEFRLHFKKEAQAVAKLSHANIVSIYDVSRDPKQDYIVMELIEGVTLKQYMKTKGRLSCRESAHFAAQIAKALAHAHGKGIIHRDIKPQNIMIGLDGRVKVADFGIAYLETALDEHKDTHLGSVHYISPEQARGLPPDARSDIYSLGVVLYEMLCGVLPFQGEDPDEVTRKHLSATPAPLHELSADIPQELEAIVEKAMAPDINRRYQSAEEMQSDLETYLGAAPGEREATGVQKLSRDALRMFGGPPPVSRSGELNRESYIRRRRRAGKVSLLTGVLLVLVFIIAVFLFLWNYWLRDLFAEPRWISVHGFSGKLYEDIINSQELAEIYNFEVNYVVDPEVEAGVVISQSPEEGANRVLDSEGINVSLTVSAGAQMIAVPDVINHRYTDAQSELQRSGFLVELIFTVNDSVTLDYVIATNPEPGDKIPAGATVYMTVSLGPDVVLLSMPDLYGMTEAEARQRVEGANLSLGPTTYLESSEKAGTVIWQSVQAHTTVNEHTKIYLQVSTGPAVTPSPSPSPSPSPTPTPAPTSAPRPVSDSNLG